MQTVFRSRLTGFACLLPSRSSGDPLLERLLGRRNRAFGNSEADRVLGFTGNDKLQFTQSEQILKSQVRGDGVIVSLRTDNWLYTNGAKSFGNTQDFAVSKDGTLYWLGTSGLLQKTTSSGWQNLATDVTKIQAHPDGRVFSLGRDNAVRQDGRLVWSGTRDFAITSSGTIYWLSTDGRFQRFTPASGWNDISGANVQFFSVAPNGSVYAFATNSIVYHYTGTGNSWNAISGTEVVSLSVAPNGSVYALTTSNIVYRYTGLGNNWDAISGAEVVSLSVAPNGGVYALTTSHIVYRYTGSANNWNAISGAEVVSLSVGPNGNVFALTTGNIVYRYTGMGVAWDMIADDVVFFALDPTGNSYLLSSEGVLRKASPGGSFTEISTSVASLSIGGRVYSLAGGTTTTTTSGGSSKNGSGTPSGSSNLGERAAKNVVFFTAAGAVVGGIIGTIVPGAGTGAGAIAGAYWGLGAGLVYTGVTEIVSQVWNSIF